jgi:hypothetical protein
MPFAAQIENVRAAIAKTDGAAAEDFRGLAEGLVQGQMATNENALTPGGQAAPAGVSMAVTGANGAHTVQINNGSQNGRTVWHEVSWSATKSFTTPVTTMPPTTASQITIPQPGVTAHFRRRSSFDGKNWSAYEAAGTQPVSAGKMTSAASVAALALNQTNYANVNASSSPGGGVSTTVTVSGPGGPYTGYVRVVGGQEVTRPSATIINPSGSTKGVIAYDGREYHASPTLAGVMKDDWEPVGEWNVNGAAGGGGAQGGNGGRLTTI